MASNPEGRVLGSGYSTLTFPSTAGVQYTIQVEGYGTCRFPHWATGVTSSEITVTALSGAQTFTAVFEC